MASGQKTVETPRQQTSDILRLLIVANETVAGSSLLQEIRRRARERRTRVLVVAPALIESRLKHALGDVDEAADEARARLARSLKRIRSVGVEADGRVGDADPNLAVTDALRTFPADEVIIATHPRERSTWLEKDVIERARREIRQPITHVVVDLEAETEREKARQVKRIPARRGRGPSGEEGLDYLPPMPVRDRLTLAVGVAGTITLGMLAIVCPEGGSVSGGCAARILIAIGAFMLTLWHSVALLLMGSVRYEGFWSELAADMVLFGIPAAIIVSLIVG